MLQSYYLDDIFVTDTSDSDHLNNLDKVLTHPKDAGLCPKQSKCVFMLQPVDYLGHQISKRRLQPTI